MSGQNPLTTLPIAEAVARLYGEQRRGEDFTDETILGSDINRIRHLFYFLRSESVEFQLNYMSDSYRVTVSDVEGNNATLEVPDFEEGSLRRCRLKLEAFNELYQFEVPIQSIAQDRIVVRIPAHIQSLQRRKHPRVQIDDLFLRFNVVYQPMFGRRGAGQLVESRYPHIVREVARDEPNLYLVNRMITEEVGRVSRENELTMYHAHPPDGFMDSMLADLRRTIFIRNTIDVGSYFEPQTVYGLANYQKEYVSLLRQKSEDEARGFFDRLRQEEARRFLYSYVCAPIKIFAEVVGRLFVYTTYLDKGTIPYEDAHRVDLLSQLLSYGLSKAVIARSYFQHAVTRVVNLSLTGLLFELNDGPLFDYLTYHDRLKINLEVKNQDLQFSGIITRYYPTDDGYHIGVNFYAAGPGDFKRLEEFLYERSRTQFR